jgi:hypothetical protein
VGVRTCLIDGSRHTSNNAFIKVVGSEVRFYCNSTKHGTGKNKKYLVLNTITTIDPECDSFSDYRGFIEQDVDIETIQNWVKNNIVKISASKSFFLVRYLRESKIGQYYDWHVMVDLFKILDKDCYIYKDNKRIYNNLSVCLKAITKTALISEYDNAVFSPKLNDKNSFNLFRGWYYDDLPSPTLFANSLMMIHIQRYFYNNLHNHLHLHMVCILPIRYNAYSYQYIYYYHRNKCIHNNCLIQYHNRLLQEV